MTDPLGDLVDRVKALERWKNTHSNLIEHDHLDDFNNRMKALEELQKKVKDLESKNIDGQYELHTCALEEHNKRLKNLEEWKHGIIHPFSPIEEYDRWRREHITLDKKVWDEIKQFVSRIGFLQPSDYLNLRDVVEKAEGGET